MIRSLQFYILLLICFSSLKAYSQFLPQGLWSIAYASSEEPINSLPSGSANKIIDGDKSTFWHSQYSGKKAINPHEIQIDLGALALIKAVVLVPRQKSSSGRCAKCELAFSEDGINWTTRKITSLFWSGNDDFSEKSIDFTVPIKAKFISYKHLSSFDNGMVDISVASLADIRVKGKYISPVVVADFRFIDNREYYVVGEEIEIKNTSSSYLSTIKSVKWNCPRAKIQLKDNNSVTLKFDKCGFYDFGLEVSNDQGFKSNKELLKKICVLPGNYLDRYKWNIVSFSEENIELKQFARNVLDSLPETIWASSWDQLKSLPHFIVFDLGENTEVNGFGYLPRQGTEIKGLVTAWTLFGSADGQNWGKAISSGVWTYENRELKLVSVAKTNCRFVKFQMDKTLPQGSSYASCAEFYIFGSPKKNILNNIYIIVGGLILIFLVVVYRKKHTKKTDDALLAKSVLDAVSAAADLPKYQVSEEIQIYLFGDFKVLDNNKNLTPLFFSKIKQLFVMLIFFPEGISIHKMSSMIWPGMPADKAVNNRSSIIKNLKTVLADLNGISLEYSNKEWKMLFDKSVYCDLHEFNKLVPHISTARDINSISHICNLVERGLFLQDMDAEWIDNVKEKITGEIIEKFSTLLTKPEPSWSSNLLLQISECILIFDEVNELAMKAKVTILISQHKNSVAKISFDNFTKKYKLFYNEEFSQTFSTFLD